jgi:hypothetical protein
LDRHKFKQARHLVSGAFFFDLCGSVNGESVGSCLTLPAKKQLAGSALFIYNCSIVRGLLSARRAASSATP